MNKKVTLMVNNLKRIIKARDMNLLQKKLYEFVHLHCGFIAHYDLHGFRHTYSDGDDFVSFLERLKDGCAVYGCDLEDNYNYGYTNKEVKEALKAELTDEVINKIKQEVAQEQKDDRHREYLKLKEEFN